MYFLAFGLVLHTLIILLMMAATLFQQVCASLRTFVDRNGDAVNINFILSCLQLFDFFLV